MLHFGHWLYTPIYYKTFCLVPDIIKAGIVMRQLCDGFTIALPLTGKVLEINKHRNFTDRL
jgi:hypothetical protein